MIWNVPDPDEMSEEMSEEEIAEYIEREQEREREARLSRAYWNAKRERARREQEDFERWKEQGDDGPQGVAAFRSGRYS